MAQILLVSKRRFSAALPATLHRIDIETEPDRRQRCSRHDALADEYLNTVGDDR
jgi:hypothetical protein